LTFSLEGVDLLRHITRTYAAVCTVTAVWFCFEPGLLIGRFEQTMRCFAGLARSEARSSHETHNGDFAIELWGVGAARGARQPVPQSITTETEPHVSYSCRRLKALRSSLGLSAPTQARAPQYASITASATLSALPRLWDSWGPSAPSQTSSRAASRCRLAGGP